MSKPSRILVIRLSALGDVAMTLPVIYSMARQNPDVQVDVLTRPFFARMFVGAPENVHLLKADFKNKYTGFFGLLNLALWLRRRGYDAVADLHNVSRSWIIDSVMRLTGVRVAMVAKLRSQRKKLLNDKVQQQPFVDRYADVFRQLGLDVTLDFKSIYADNAVVATPIEVQQPAIGIAPFARFKSKTLPADTMFGVVQRLASWGWNVYLFGAKTDDKILSEWAEQTENCVSLAGRYSLEEELAIMSRLDVMLSMDSANQHLASLVGTRVVSIWGSTTPLCGFLGYGQKADDVVCRNLQCQPCSIGGIAGDCRQHYACLNQIDINDILKKI